LFFDILANELDVDYEGYWRDSPQFFVCKTLLADGSTVITDPTPQNFTCVDWAFRTYFNFTGNSVSTAAEAYYHCVDIVQNENWSVLPLQNDEDDRSVYFEFYQIANFSLDYYFTKDSHDPWTFPALHFDVIYYNSDNDGVQYECDLEKDVFFDFTKTVWQNRENTYVTNFAPVTSQTPVGAGLSYINFDSTSPKCQGQSPCAHIQQLVVFNAASFTVFKSVEETDLALAQRIITSTASLLGGVGGILAFIFLFFYRVKYYPNKHEAVSPDLRNAVLHLIEEERKKRKEEKKQKNKVTDNKEEHGVASFEVSDKDPSIN